MSSYPMTSQELPRSKHPFANGTHWMIGMQVLLQKILCCIKDMAKHTPSVMFLRVFMQRRWCIEMRYSGRGTECTFRMFLCFVPSKQMSRAENLRAGRTCGVVVVLMCSKAFLRWERTQSWTGCARWVHEEEMHVLLVDGVEPGSTQTAFGVEIKVFLF